jgi:hypothetical protein
LSIRLYEKPSKFKTIDEENEGIYLLKNKLTDKSHSFRYFRYFMRIKYLLDIKKNSIDLVLSSDFDELKLDREVELWLKQSPQKQNE